MVTPMFMYTVRLVVKGEDEPANTFQLVIRAGCPRVAIIKALWKLRYSRTADADNCYRAYIIGEPRGTF